MTDLNDDATEWLAAVVATLSEGCSYTLDADALPFLKALAVVPGWKDRPDVPGTYRWRPCSAPWETREVFSHPKYGLASEAAEGISLPVSMIGGQWEGPLPPATPEDATNE